MDDDNYVNVRSLVKFLSRYPHTQDMYVGKPSLDRPIEATERLGDNKMVCSCLWGQFLVRSAWTALIVRVCLSVQKAVNFWFATGGAGFCVSRGLALKMSPWARWEAGPALSRLCWPEAENPNGAELASVLILFVPSSLQWGSLYEHSGKDPSPRRLHHRLHH